MRVFSCLLGPLQAAALNPALAGGSSINTGAAGAITLPSNVCCSITSETRMADGSVVFRQGRSRPFAWYQAKSSTFIAATVAAALTAGAGRFRVACERACPIALKAAASSDDTIAGNRNEDAEAEEGRDG